MKLLPTLVAALLLKFAFTPIAVAAEEQDRLPETGEMLSVKP